VHKVFQAHHTLLILINMHPVIVDIRLGRHTFQQHVAVVKINSSLN